VPTTHENPVQPAESLQVREWYPSPRYQEVPFYAFPPAPGQDRQQRQIITAPPAQTGQAYNAGRPWTPAWPSYPAQPGVTQYPVTDGWSSYGQVQGQQPVAQPQYSQTYPQYRYVPQYQPAAQYQQPYQPVPQNQQPYQPVPQNQQPYQPVPQYQQPYQVQQPQFQPAQRPWGAVEDSTGNSSRGGRQSLETWQMTNQYPVQVPPANNGFTGTPQYYVAPGYYR